MKPRLILPFPLLPLLILVLLVAAVYGIHRLFTSSPSHSSSRSAYNQTSSSSSSNNSANAHTMRFQTFILQDDPTAFGGEVSRMLIPAGWKTQGGMAYDFNCFYPAQVNLRIYDPAQPRGFAIYPSSYFIWGDLPGFAPGNNYGGSIVAEPVQDPYEAIKQFVIAKYRPELANATIVETELLPRLAETTLRQLPSPPGAQTTLQAARLRVEYTLNNTTVQEDFYAVMRQEVMGGFELWNVDQAVSVWAEKGSLDKVREMHDVSMRSVKSGLTWFNRYIQYITIRQQNNMAAIQSAGDFSRRIAQDGDHVSDMIREQYENQQAAEDRISEARSETMRGETPWDTGDGNKVLLPSDYGHAWRDNSGQYVVSNDSLYDPNTDPNFINSTWTSMQQLQQ